MYRTRVLSRREPADPKTYQWLDRLRESNPPRIYPVDPFAEVFRLRDNIFSIFTESADGMGDTWHHLIVGPEKALLLDTGFGIGNLRGLVEELIGTMPLLVCNTHEHLDHCYGNCQFDKVYCHEYGYGRVLASKRPDIWDGLFDENGRGKWLECDRSDLIPFKDYEIVPVPDGTIFNLGEDHRIELFHTGGHAAGGLSFLDRKNRILFSGAMHTARIGAGTRVPRPVVGLYETITAFRDSLEKIVPHFGEFDSIFFAHEIQDVPPSFLTDLLALCKAIIADPQANDFSFVRNNGSTALGKSLGQATIIYIAEGV